MSTKHFNVCGDTTVVTKARVGTGEFFEFMDVTLASESCPLAPKAGSPETEDYVREVCARYGFTAVSFETRTCLTYEEATDED